MRITNKMISDNVFLNIQSSLRRISKLHEQLSSGYKVKYPSDNAVVATRASDIMTKLREITKFKENIDHVQTYVNAYDSAIQKVSSLVQRLRELLVQAANDTLSQDERRAIAEEMEKINENLVEIANTRVGNEYVFGGYNAFTPPIRKEGEEWKIVTLPEASKKRYILALGHVVEYGVAANEVFRLPDGRNIFQVIDETVKKLKTEERVSRWISEISLKNLSIFEENVMKVIGEIGGTSKMLEMIGSRLEDLNFFFTEYLSKERDADITEVISKLTTEQAVLQAALKSAAHVLQLTLVDFVR